jgi:WD40 repeat protein
MQKSTKKSPQRTVKVTLKAPPTPSATTAPVIPTGPATPVALTATVAKAEAWKSKAATGKQVFNAVAISANGSRVAGGTFVLGPGKHTVNMYAWDAGGTELLHDSFQATAPVPAPPAVWTRRGIMSVSISNNGRWAASGGGLRPGAAGQPADSGFIDLYDLNANPPTKRSTLVVAGSMVNSVAISGDGSCLAAGADQIYISRRTGSTWSAPVAVAVPAVGVERVSSSNDGSWIAAAVRGGWVVLVKNSTGEGAVPTSASWQLPLNPAATPPDDHFHAQTVSMASDGSGFAVAGADGNVYYFDINAFTATGNLAPAWTFLLTNCRACKWVSVSSDGSKIAAVGSEVNAAKHLTGKGSLFLLSNNGNSAASLWPAVPYTLDGPNCISTDDAATYVAAADGTSTQSHGAFYLCKGSDGSLSWRYPTTKMDYGITISSNGNAVAGASNNGRVYYFTVP